MWLSHHFHLSPTEYTCAYFSSPDLIRWSSTCVRSDHFHTFMARHITIKVEPQHIDSSAHYALRTAATRHTQRDPLMLAHLQVPSSLALVVARSAALWWRQGASPCASVVHARQQCPPPVVHPFGLALSNTIILPQLFSCTYLAPVFLNTTK